MNEDDWDQELQNEFAKAAARADRQWWGGFVALCLILAAIAALCAMPCVE